MGWSNGAVGALLLSAAAVAGWTWTRTVWAPRWTPAALLQMANPYIHRVNPPFPDKSFYFPDADVVEQAWRDVAREWRAAVEPLRDLSALPDAADVEPAGWSQPAPTAGSGGLVRTGAWKIVPVVMLWAPTDNAAAFPATMAALERCRWIRGAAFHVFAPGTELAPHAGASSAQIRYHLGIVAPEPASAGALIVEGRERQWQEGVGFVWDDRFVHAARNSGTEPRVVLVLDLDRRDMTIVGLVVDYLIAHLFRSQPYFERAVRSGRLPPRSGEAPIVS